MRFDNKVVAKLIAQRYELAEALRSSRDMLDNFDDFEIAKEASDRATNILANLDSEPKRLFAAKQNEAPIQDKPWYSVYQPEQPMVTEKLIDYWADWLVDAVATATQNRAFLRNEPQEDEAATEAIYANGKKAIENVLENLDHPKPTSEQPADKLIKGK